jgi:crossover junction endodeoxyribonuclease RuvC
MLVIGVDPGIERTGVGIVESTNGKLKLIHQKLIKTSSAKPQAERLSEIYDELNSIIKEYAIEFASVEKLFFAKNVKTAMTVSEARGIIILALFKNKIPIYEYTPLQVKQALIGYGRGTKDQIQELVKIILNLQEIPKPDDVADGIALAITHINTYKLLSKIIEKRKT